MISRIYDSDEYSSSFRQKSICTPFYVNCHIHSKQSTLLVVCAVNCTDFLQFSQLSCLSVCLVLVLVCLEVEVWIIFTAREWSMVNASIGLGARGKPWVWLSKEREPGFLSSAKKMTAVKLDGECKRWLIHYMITIWENTKSLRAHESRKLKAREISGDQARELR